MSDTELLEEFNREGYIAIQNAFNQEEVDLALSEAETRPDGRRSG